MATSAATATLAAAEAAAADDGLSEGIIRIKLIEYHGKAGCDAMGKNAIKNAKERRQGRHPELSAAGPWSLDIWTHSATTVDIAPSIEDSSFFVLENACWPVQTAKNFLMARAYRRSRL